MRQRRFGEMLGVSRFRQGVRYHINPHYTGLRPLAYQLFSPCLQVAFVSIRTYAPQQTTKIIRSLRRRRRTENAGL